MEQEIISKKARTQKDKADRKNGAVKKNAGSGRGRKKPADQHSDLEVRFIKSRTNLSKSRQRLLNKILSEPHESFFLSSREMARRYGVDSSTIVRTVQAMGYKKFADFADDLRNHFVTQITPYTAMKAAAAKKGSLADYIQRSVDQDLENLNTLKANLDVNKITDLINQIHRTQRITVVGIDYAAPLANLLAYGLMKLGCNAEAPIGSTGVMQNKVKLLTKKDLLIAISFGQGLRETIRAVQRAKQQNVPTFGITDGDKTPIARFCEQYIVTSTERTSFLDSYVAPVVAINLILVAYAHSQPKRALELLAKIDEEDSNGDRWYRENRDFDPE